MDSCPLSIQYPKSPDTKDFIGIMKGLQMKKRYTTIWLFLFCLIGLLAGGLTTFVVWKAEERRDAFPPQTFVPVEEAFTLAGFTPEEKEATFVSFSKKELDVLATVDLQEEAIRKNGYLFPAEGMLYKHSDGTFYAHKDVLEVVLNAYIAMEGGQLKVIPRVYTIDDLYDLEAPLIAHAGGGLFTTDEDGNSTALKYTNSVEAIAASYNRGLRVFEIDFHKTSDGRLVCAHNWNKEYGGTKLSYDEFMESPLWGLTQMDAERLVQQMAINQDIFVVLDMKSSSWTKKETKAFYKELIDTGLHYGGEALVDRIIPQIYSMEEYDKVNQYYDFKGIIYTLYLDKESTPEQIRDFAQDKDDLFAIAIPKKRVTKEFSDILHAGGKTVLTYTINATEDLYGWLDLGVDGFYTDFMNPQAIHDLYGAWDLHLLAAKKAASS